MGFDEMVAALEASVLHASRDFSQRVIKHVVACDLMSDVLVEDRDDFLLVTSLPSEQAARTSDMVGASGILLVNGKEAQPGLKKLAVELDLNLMSTGLSGFEACVRLGKLLEL